MKRLLMGAVALGLVAGIVVKSYAGWIVTGTVVLASPADTSTYKINATVHFTSGHTLAVSRGNVADPTTGTWNFINGWGNVQNGGTDSGTLSWSANDLSTKTATNAYLDVTMTFPTAGPRTAYAKDKWNGVVPNPTTDFTTYNDFNIVP